MQLPNINSRTKTIKIMTFKTINN